jgi:hypothetical protein
MVGGGIVDPGMMDVVETADVDGGSDANAHQVDHTESAHLEEAGADGEGQYLDEAGAHEHGEHDPMNENENGFDDGEPEEMDAGEDYNEFAQDNPSEASFVEETPSWQEPDWVSPNADGSFDITPPEGVSVDEGIASFPVDVANEALELPEDVQLQADGSMNVQLPEGSEFHAESNTLVMPEGSVPLEEIPENFNPHHAPTGEILVDLPEQGVEFDAESNTLNIDNYHVNEMTPDYMEVTPEGQVDITLPEEGVEYNDDGSLHFSESAVSHMDAPAPDYVSEMEFADYNADGSVTVTPPEGISADGGIVEVPNDMIDEHIPMEEGFTVNADGTADIALPEGAHFDADAGAVVMPEGEINLDEVPEGIDAHLNPDGTTTVMLSEGMEYNSDTHSVNLDNYWANELTPDNVAIDEAGALNVALPEGTEFYEDGSFTVPAEHADFAYDQAPDYVHDVEFSEQTPEGHYHVNPPEGMNINMEQGTLEIPHEMIDEHVPTDEGLQFHEDGSATASLPEGVEYSPEDNVLTFPEGELHPDEIPAGIDFEYSEDGTMAITLPDGMEYDSAAGELHVDNYWANQLSPEPVTITETGEMHVHMPSDVEYHNDGTFTIPEHSADFLENPEPDYVMHGPDWVNETPSGSVMIEAPEGMELNPTEGTANFDSEFAHEHFDNYIPEGVEFHGDGTMSVMAPEGTNFDPESNTLTFPEGEVHMHEIPEQAAPELMADGSIQIQMQPGMEFDPETGQIHLDNYWTNELTPEPVEFTPEGQFNVEFPHDVNMQESWVEVPEESANFMAEPYPEYVDHGPEWVTDNPDGSVTVAAPDGAQIDPEAGTFTMSAEMAMEELHGDLIPEDFTLNEDGSASISLPEGSSFEDGVLTLPEGEGNINDLPEGVEAQYNEAGNLTITLPEGIEFDAESNSVNVSNEWINQMAPEPIEFTPEGEFVIHLPEDTQYFEAQDSFVISSESADFLDDGDHHEHYEAGAHGPAHSQAA